MKKSRKRLLISSVAMLLVAMLALGTATFAWFTTSTTARTQNLSVQTTKASTLTISKSTGGWGNLVDYNHGSSAILTLDPASTVLGGKTAGNWFNCTAAAGHENDGVADVTTIKTLTASDTGTAIGGFVFMEQLNVRNEGSAAVHNVKINFTLPDSEGYNYVRVALVPTTAQGTAVQDAYGTGKAFKDYVYASNGTAYNGVKGTKTEGTDTVLDTESITPKNASAATFSIDVTASGESLAAVTGTGDNKQYDARFYNLYVWFEGQDPQCINANAGQIIPDIVFTVTGDAVQS